MKKSTFIMALLTILTVNYAVNAQNSNRKFKMEGPKSEVIELNETFTSSQEIFPFEKKKDKIYGLAVSADIVLQDETSVVRLLLVDTQYREHLIYESYALLDGAGSFSIEELAEETALMEGIMAHSVKLEITNAEIALNNLILSTQIDPGIKIENVKKEKKQQQNEDKINRINKNLQAKNMKWVAGHTEVSQLSYSDKKKLFGQSTFPAGFEYYAGGVISTTTENSGDISLKSATASAFVEEWDWRNRHGKNWITPISNQRLCGSCWSFASAGATEALVNLYFNQQLNIDLSEQDLISCSGAGGCNGGYPSIALDYITNNGIVDEATFPYSEADESCSNKGSAPSELIKIGGKVAFGSADYPKTEEVLKQLLIEMGPLSGGLYDWSHAMVLVGYKVVKEGDIFYNRGLDLQMKWITISAGDLLIGKTVWIFKNSWGSYFGDEGYVYVETPITNMGWTHGLKAPVTSSINNYQVICEDKDGDGYFWWGLGEKPATCSGPDEPDGDDSDPTLGPLDAYGNCRILNGTPTAGFSASVAAITEGETVNYTDLSVNAQSWSWAFEGGTPVTSDLKNPAVTYSTPGIYNVSLTVTNMNGSDTKTVENFLTVEQAEEPVVIDEPVIIDKENTASYCASGGNATEEWISSVAMGVQVHSSGSAGTAGYQDYTGIVFTAEAGTRMNFTLSPLYSKRWQYEYWRIWIDYNRDGDFNDSGELVYTSSGTRDNTSGSFMIPSGISATTRLRVSMKRNSLPAPCEVFLNGEVEDYSIHITEPAPQPPAAAFNLDKNSVTPGETIQFTDMSSNAPTQWQWQFPGGTPSTSTLQHPAVIYSTPGVYDVTLTVSKEGFDPSHTTKTSCIMVNDNPSVDYCIPFAVNSVSDFIMNITIGNVINSTAAGNGYTLSAVDVTLRPGQNYSFTLTPKVSTNRNYWRIWMDFNSDGDFEDSGETLLALNNKKGQVYSEIILPDYATGKARMRIAMRNQTAPAPCDDGYDGDIKDFNVSFDAAPQASIFTSTEENLSDKKFGAVIFPNPVTDKLTIQLDSPQPGDFYNIYSMTGEKLQSDRILTKSTIIDFSKNAPGIYFIVAENNNRIFRKKIIKN